MVRLCELQINHYESRLRSAYHLQQLGGGQAHLNLPLSGVARMLLQNFYGHNLIRSFLPRFDNLERMHYSCLVGVCGGDSEMSINPRKTHGKSYEKYDFTCPNVPLPRNSSTS